MKKLDDILIDKKDCLILNLLQENCRMSLTEISKKLGLSIDSVKKRISKMISKRIFYPKIQLRPRHFGFPNMVDIKIKLRNYSDRDIKNFIEYLKQSPFVTEIFSVSGDWDYSIVLMAKNAEEFGVLTDTIRKKFRSIINEWSESLTKFVYKFENYDMPKLMGYEIEKIIVNRIK